MNCLRLALGCLHFPGLSRSGSGTGVLHKRADSGLRFVPFPGPSSSGDQEFGKRCHCDLSSSPSLLLGFLVVQLAHLLRWMSTVQNPKKSWLAMKPACSLVDDASLGPQLLPFFSGCPHLPVSGGGWAIHSCLALLGPLFCEQAWWCLRLGLFAR